MHVRSAQFIAALLLTTAMTDAIAAKSIDLSNKSEPGEPYKIDFCSRPSPEGSGQPGHAFVAFSSAGPGGTRSFRAVGLQPSSLGGALKSLLTGTDNGYVATEKYTAVLQNCLAVRVNKVDYERALQSALPSFAALGITNVDVPHLENYGLGADDCIGYVQRVGDTLKVLGLKVPTRNTGELPRPYIQRLEAAN